MDNIEDTGPQGAADVTAAQGQPDAEPDTQPAESEQETVTLDNDEDTEEGTEETGDASTPWANDPKFKDKSADDIYKAYQEAQKAIGQVSEKAEIANLIEEKYGLTPEQFKAQVENMEHQQKQQLYANNPLAPIVDEVEGLKKELSQQKQQAAYQSEEKKLDEFLKENPDYEPFKDKILKIGLNLETDKPYEDIASEYFGKSRAQGQQDAYKKIETKKMTQATGAQSAPKRKFSEEEKDKMSAEELEAILPHADTSHRLY